MAVKFNILIMGSGRIGIAVAVLLSSCDDYKVFLTDIYKRDDIPLVMENPIQSVIGDITDADEIVRFIKQNNIHGVISCLPFNLTLNVAQIAHQCGICYFDPTEDVATTSKVIELAKTSTAAFVPQCGLAPGFISIAATSLMKDMDEIDMVKMRVGALTQSISNSLMYGITWSIDGVVNEYIHPCVVIKDGKKKLMPALGEIETIVIDGNVFEAFHTSGGIGSLADTYLGRVKNLDYKSIRIPGHCEKMHFLLNDLKLREQPELLKEILFKVIPHVDEDKVVIYVSVQGLKQGRLIEKTYTNTLYPHSYNGYNFTAIQMTTASSICTMVDLVMKDGKFNGLVKQEQVKLSQFLDNRFGKYYSKNKNL